MVLLVSTGDAGDIVKGRKIGDVIMPDREIETLFDDRDKKTSPGVKFNESELIGIPHRIVVSPRSLQDNCIEYTSRGTGQGTRINLEDLDEFLINVVCVK